MTFKSIIVSEKSNMLEKYHIFSFLFNKTLNDMEYSFRFYNLYDNIQIVFIILLAMTS